MIKTALLYGLVDICLNTIERTVVRNMLLVKIRRVLRLKYEIATTIDLAKLVDDLAQFHGHDITEELRKSLINEIEREMDQINSTIKVYRDRSTDSRVDDNQWDREIDEDWLR